MIKDGNVHRFAHHGYVYCMLLLDGAEHGQPLNDTLITGGGDGVIKLWSLDKENGSQPYERLDLDDGKDSSNPVLSIALDGTFLYGARGDGMINVWYLATRQLLRTIDTRVREDVLTLSVGGGCLYAGLVDGSIMVSLMPAVISAIADQCRRSIKDTSLLSSGKATTDGCYLRVSFITTSIEQSMSLEAMIILLPCGLATVARVLLLWRGQDEVRGLRLDAIET